MGKVFLSAAAVLWLVCAGRVYAQSAWESIGRELTGVTAVAAGQEKEKVTLYAGGQRRIAVFDQDADTWKTVLRLRSAAAAVNEIVIDPREGRTAYAATSEGLYRSLDSGNTWKRLFRGENSAEAECLSTAVLPSGIFAGTRAGIFISRDGGRTFRKVSGSAMTLVRRITLNRTAPDVVYAAALEGVYRSVDNGAVWEKIFSGHPRVDEDIPAGDDPDDGDEQRMPDLRSVVSDPEEADVLYAAAGRGVFVSRNRGGAWEALSMYGFLGGDPEILFVSDTRELYAAGASGVFLFNDGRWQEISAGLEAGGVRSLAGAAAGGRVYAAGDKGVFLLEKRTRQTLRQEGGSCRKAKESTVEELQREAVRYADLDPRKITRWKEQAARKAWLPTLSVGVDRSSSDLWHWEGGSTTKAEDDVLRKGRASTDWDVSLSWDLGELIWNDDQTSIDVRSRLITELRNSILDEVAKLYFERQRLMHEIENLPLEDKKRGFEKELKLREVTAVLDGLTGGYLSRRMNP